MTKENEPLNKEEIGELEAYGEAYYKLIEIFTNPDISSEEKDQYLLNIEDNFPGSFDEIAREISMSIQSAAIRMEGVNRQIIHYSNDSEEWSDNEKLKNFYIGLVKKKLQEENNDKEIPPDHWEVISKSATLEISEFGYPLLSLSEDGIKILERLIGINIDHSGLHYSIQRNGINIQFIVMFEKNNAVLKHELHHAIYRSNNDLLGLKDVDDEHISEIVFDLIRDELIAYLIDYHDGFNPDFNLRNLTYGVNITQTEQQWLNSKWPEVKKELIQVLERLKANDKSPMTLVLPITHSTSIENMLNIFKNILPDDNKTKGKRSFFGRRKN